MQIEKILIYHNNYVAIDDTLDRLQLKYKNKILNSKVEDEEKLFHHRKNSNGQSNDDKDKQTNYSFNKFKNKINSKFKLL